MMLNKFRFLASLSLLSTALVAGCATDVEIDDEAGVEEAELSSAGKALIGSYTGNSGSFHGLILTATKVGQGNEFIADVDTGIRCITTPCPSSERIKGTFTAGSKTITFKSSTASQHVQHLLGRYRYTVQGTKFSLSRGGSTQSLEKVTSYCAESSDCYAQDIIHPMCMGGFSCTAQNTCKWSCGQWPPPPADPCDGLELQECIDNSECKPEFGPSACSPDGMICTDDIAYKGCLKKPAGGEVCLSSGTCSAGQHCSTEDGVCNSHGMLAVCAGTCVP